MKEFITKNKKLLLIIGASVLCVAIVVTMIVVAVSKNNAPKGNDVAKDSMSQTETTSNNVSTETQIDAVTETQTEIQTEAQTETEVATESQEQEPEPAPKPEPAPEPTPAPVPAPQPEPQPTPQPVQKTIAQLKAEAVEVPREQFDWLSFGLADEYNWDNEDGLTCNTHEYGVLTERWIYDGAGHKILFEGYYAECAPDDISSRDFYDKVFPNGKMGIEAGEWIFPAKYKENSINIQFLFF